MNPMKNAPTDGSVIRAYIYTTRRPVLVRWNGRFWDEGNGEKWDAAQLSGWDYDPSQASRVTERPIAKSHRQECRQCGRPAKHCGCTFPDLADERLNILQQLHDSEINGRISWFYDRHWRAELGDKMNGFIEGREADTYTEAEAALAEMALSHFPNSEFAKKKTQSQ